MSILFKWENILGGYSIGDDNWREISQNNFIPSNIKTKYLIGMM